jgi:pilus assembly protein CpaB
MTSKKNLITLLGIAFVVAIIATGLFYGLVVNKLNDNAAASRDTVVVAAKNLEPGHELTPADVKAVPRASVDALVSGFETPERVSGLVVMVPIAAGGGIDKTMVASATSSLGGALGVPAGMRAVSIHVADSTGVVQLLQTGHRVDAQLVTHGGRNDVVSVRTVLQNLEVLRVEEEGEATEGRPMLPVVTLLATPEEADVLAVADAAARLRLLLRHPLDPELTDRSSVALAGVLRNPPKQEPRGPSVTRTTPSKEEGAASTVETAQTLAGSGEAATR